MNQVIFIVISLLVFLGAIGWGRTILSYFKLSESPSMSFACGLAAYYFLSGVLSVFLLFTYIFGALFFILGLLLLLRDMKFILPCFNRYFFINFAILNALYIYIAPYAVPNFHDDYQKYFLHPFYLLNSGTLFYNPFGAGYETLGAFAFIQALYFPYLPLHYLLYCDFYLGMLGLNLLFQEKLDKEKQWISLVLTLFVVAIPLQMVNSSPLYLPIFFIVLCFYYLVNSHTKSYIVIFSFLAFLLLSSKLSYLVFIPFLFFLGVAFDKNRMQNLLTYFLAIVVGILLVSPWLPSLLHPYLLPNLNFEGVVPPQEERLPYLYIGEIFCGGNYFFHIALLIAPILFFSKRLFSTMGMAIFTPFLVSILFFLSVMETPIANYLTSVHGFRFLIPSILATFLFYVLFSSSFTRKYTLGFVLLFLILVSAPTSRLSNLLDNRTIMGLIFDPQAEPVEYRKRLEDNSYIGRLEEAIRLIPPSSKIAIFVPSLPKELLHLRKNLLPLEFTSLLSPRFDLFGVDYLLTTPFEVTNIVNSLTDDSKFDTFHHRRYLHGARYFVNLIQGKPIYRLGSHFIAVYLPDEHGAGSDRGWQLPQGSVQ